MHASPPTTCAGVRSLILSVLQEVQEMSGREWNGLVGDAKPIGALEGFDSLSGIEVTVMIEERLGRGARPVSPRTGAGGTPY